jgi:peptidoglycan/xylan/chitin deacetylase (PgdA/CDA1 family)
MITISDGFQTVKSLIRRGDDGGKRKLVLTFDDGFKNNFGQAAPILKKYGLPATFFVIASKLDGGDDRFMLTSDAVRLLECDLFGIGSHSLNHRSMAQISEDDRTEESVRRDRSGAAAIRGSAATVPLVQVRNNHADQWLRCSQCRPQRIAAWGSCWSKRTARGRCRNRKK